MSETVCYDPDYDLLGKVYMRSVYEYVKNNSLSYEDPRSIVRAMSFARDKARDEFSRQRKEIEGLGAECRNWFFEVNEAHATATAVFLLADLGGLSLEETHPYCRATAYICPLVAALAFNMAIDRAFDVLDFYNDGGSTNIFSQSQIEDASPLLCDH